MVIHSNSTLLESIEGSTIVSGEINENEGLTLYLADGRCLVFVSDAFAMKLFRLSKRELH